MKRILAWGYLVIVGLTFSACTPPPVIEVDIRLGTPIDSSSGFYAYTTGLVKTDLVDLKVSCSSEPSIQGRIAVNSPELEYVYPVTAYIHKRIYVRPADLAAKIKLEMVKLEVIEPLPEDSVHTLGYFRKALTGASTRDRKLDQINSGL